MQLEIRARLGVSEALRHTIERRMAFALGRFGARISAVTVWLSRHRTARAAASTRSARCRSPSPPGRGCASRTPTPTSTRPSAGRPTASVGPWRATWRDGGSVGGLTLRDLAARATRGIR